MAGLKQVVNALQIFSAEKSVFESVFLAELSNLRECAEGSRLFVWRPRLAGHSAPWFAH